LLLFIMYYIRTVPARHHNVLSFYRFVYAVVYGDDILFTVRTDLFINFTLAGFCAYVCSIGMCLTDADKTGNPVYKSINDVSFLKRKFRVCGCYVFPLLNMDSIHSMLNYVRKQPNLTHNQAIEVNVQTACRYVFFYGGTEYGHFVKQIQSIMHAYMFNMCLPSYNQLSHTYFDVSSSSMYSTLLPIWQDQQ